MDDDDDDADDDEDDGDDRERNVLRASRRVRARVSGVSRHGRASAIGRDARVIHGDARERGKGGRRRERERSLHSGGGICGHEGGICKR